MDPRVEKLGAFIRFLENELGREVEDRLKLQKYVFIADHFGLNSGYDFSMYVRGPYSPELAEDYLRASEMASINQSEAYLPSEFNKDEFIKFVRNKDKEWLEIATTVLAIYEYNKDRGISRDDIIKIATSIGPWSKDRVEVVLDELLGANLICL